MNGVNQILDTDDSLCAHQLFDRHVVRDGSFGVILSPQEASLSDEVIHRLLRRSAPGQEVLHQRELLGELRGRFQEHHVVHLFQAEGGENFLGLGRRVLGLGDSHGQDQLVSRWDVERLDSLVFPFLRSKFAYLRLVMLVVPLLFVVVRDKHLGNEDFALLGFFLGIFVSVGAVHEAAVQALGLLLVVRAPAPEDGFLGDTTVKRRTYFSLLLSIL